MAEIKTYNPDKAPKKEEMPSLDIPKDELKQYKPLKDQQIVQETEILNRPIISLFEENKSKENCFRTLHRVL